MKMKMLCVFGMFAIQACAAEPADEMKEQAVSANPMHWMVGVWDCKVVNYHAVPEANTVNHQMSAVYTVIEDAAGIHGQYRETGDGAFEPLDYDEEWTISDQRWPQDKAWVFASYQAHGTSQIFSIQAAGVVRGPSETSNLLGFAMFGSPSTPDMPGTLTLPDPFGKPVTRGWGGVGAASAFPTPDVISLSRNWRVQVNTQGTKRQYIDNGCIRRPDA